MGLEWGEVEKVENCWHQDLCIKVSLEKLQHLFKNAVKVVYLLEKGKKARFPYLDSEWEIFSLKILEHEACLALVQSQNYN